jgi:hypothetical protein
MKVGMRCGVGFREGRSADSARQDWDGDGPRPLTWAACDPASDDAVERELIAGSPCASWFVCGSAARDAPLHQAQRRYPVVLLSHATRGAAPGLEWLGRRLAQRGFVAIEPYRAEGFLCLCERARDLTVMLDERESRADVAGRLDMERVFVTGFSAGADTALALLGAVTAFSRFQTSRTDRGFVPGPREFPDLADQFAGLLERSAVFRDSWARMSDSYRDPRFRAALVCAPGRSALGFGKASLALIKAPVRRRFSTWRPRRRTVQSGFITDCGQAQRRFWRQGSGTTSSFNNRQKRAVALDRMSARTHPASIAERSMSMSLNPWRSCFRRSEEAVRPAS